MRKGVMLVLGAMAMMAATVRAGVPTPATPLGMDCINVNADGADSCTNTGTAGATGGYNLGVAGLFNGTVVASLTDGINTRTFSCSGLVIGILSPEPGGSCMGSGNRPPPGAAMTLRCDSIGIGVIACFVRG